MSDPEARAIAARLTEGDVAIATALLVAEAEKADAAAQQPGWRPAMRAQIRNRAAALRRSAEALRATLVEMEDKA